MNDEHKPTYQKNIVVELQIMADYRFQHYCTFESTRWWWLYKEFYEVLFEDSTLVETWEEGDWMFNQEIDTAIAALKPELKKIPYGILEQIVIDMPQMQVLREKAAAILAMMGKPPVAPYDIS